MAEEFSTKTDLDVLRAGIREDAASFAKVILEQLAADRLEVLERLGAVRAELVERMNAVQIDLIERLDVVRNALIERDESVETKLLKEFRKWAISFESKFKANEALVVGFSERMSSLEERVGDLERRD